MDDALLRTIAERFGTPTYVYDLARLRHQRESLLAAFPGARLLYAVKANPSGAVLRALASLGVGAEVITVGELERAVRAGMAPGDVLVGGPAQDARLVRRASELGVGLVSLDSAGQWRGWQAANAPAPRFLVRVNPGLDPGTHEHLATGAASSKFGLSPAAALALAREVHAAGRLAGFHVHAGSMIRDAGVYDAIREVLEPLYRALPGLELLDLGGGFAVPEPPLDAFGERATALARSLGARLLLEPGPPPRGRRRDAPHPGTPRQAGRAPPARHRGRRHGRPAPARALRRRTPDPRGDGGDEGPADGAAVSGDRGELQADGPVLSDLDGPLCENADRLGRDRRLPGVRPGALLAVELVGAYGFAMASNYASSLRPAEVVVDAAGDGPAMRPAASPARRPAVPACGSRGAASVQTICGAWRTRRAPPRRGPPRRAIRTQAIVPHGPEPAGPPLSGGRRRRLPERSALPGPGRAGSTRAGRVRAASRATKGAASRLLD